MTKETSATSLDPLATVVGHTSTDIGMRREENQDSLGVIECHAFKFFIVADGMGGMRGGATASKMAVSVFESEIRAATELTPSLISSAACAANKAIFNKSAEDPDLTGMGTTLVGLGFTTSKLFVLNVGDSRAYRVRNGTLTQLTEDHTLVGELIRSGSITPAQAQSHPVSHMLTRSLGPSAEVEIDCLEYPEAPRAGDIYLLCSDGLYNMVGQSEILDVANTFELSEIGPELISLANLRGGPDNISVIVVAITGESEKMAPEAHTVLEASAPGSSSAGSEAPAPASTAAPSHPSPSEPDIDPPLDKALQSSSGALSEPSRSPQRHSFIHEYRYPFLFMLLAGVATTILSWPHKSPPAQARSSAAEVSIVSAPPLVEDLPITASASSAPHDATSVSASPTVAIEITAEAGIALESTREEQLDALANASTPPAELTPQKSRPELLAERIHDLKERLEAFDQPISGKTAQLLGDSLAKVAELQNQRDALSFDIDRASASLTKWLDVKHRLSDKNQVDLASEIAPLSSEIQQTLELFRRATWNYIQAADSAEHEASPVEHDARLQQLAKNRSDALATLGVQMTEITSKKITVSDAAVRDLTLRREALTSAIKELQEEISFHRILMSGDSVAREQKRKEISVSLSQAQEELDQLQMIPEHNENK